MSLKKHATILINGFVVVAPILITVYAVVAALQGLDRLVSNGLSYVWEEPWPGIGVVVGVAGVYLIGFLTRNWLFANVIKLGERIVGRIPLVKSLYSAVRDLLQFLGGTEEKDRGKPAAINFQDGTVQFLGLITQEHPGKFLSDDMERVAVYLPMSYQIGGFTVYVPREAVQELKGLSVEDLLKLSLTAGVGSETTEQEPTQERAAQQ